MKYSIVKKAVDAADPCGLLEHGAPDDEYDGESADIAAAVNIGDTEERIAEIAAEVFSGAFSWEFNSGGFHGFARDVWSELRKNGLI